MESTNNGTNGLGSLATAAVATSASFLPQLTDWVRLLTAVVGLLCALYGAYRLFKSK
jgi:hypothetical protein